MLGRIAWRLGFIFCLAATARIIGGFFAPEHPPVRAIPDITASLPDDPLPTSPEMRRAIAQVRLADGWGHSGEAQLTFGQGADSITVTPRELAAARALVRRNRDSIDRQIALIEGEEKRDTVSFRPGEPMIDPNPGTD